MNKTTKRMWAVKEHGSKIEHLFAVRRLARECKDEWEFLYGTRFSVIPVLVEITPIKGENRG